MRRESKWGEGNGRKEGVRDIRNGGVMEDATGRMRAG